LDGAWITSK